MQVYLHECLQKTPHFAPHLELRVGPMHCQAPVLCCACANVEVHTPSKELACWHA